MKIKYMIKPSEKLNLSRNISDRIEYIRCVLGYPETTFARKLGTVKSSITKVISGEEDPSFKMTKNILQIFPVDKTWLYTGAGTPFTTNDLSKFYYEAEARTESVVDRGVSARLKQIRVDKELSQVLFASEIGSSRDTVAFIESDRSAPSIPLLKRVVKKYKVNWDWLMDGDGPSYRP